jgi:hypothetical protein
VFSIYPIYYINDGSTSHEKELKNPRCNYFNIIKKSKTAQIPPNSPFPQLRKCHAGTSADFRISGNVMHEQTSDFRNCGNAMQELAEVFRESGTIVHERT